jgi:PAS domain S-box-containing protein
LWRRSAPLSEDAEKTGRSVAEDFEDLYENAPCGYLSLGPDGRIVKSNLTLSSWIGFSREELLGKRLRDILNVAGAIFYETHFAPLLRMQGFFNEVALDLVTADGKKLAVLSRDRATPLRTRAGRSAPCGRARPGT